MVNKTSWIWVLMIAAYLLAGCLPGPAPSSANPLSASNWRLVSLGSAALLTPTDNLTLQLDQQGFARGSTGCNEFSGPYQASQGRIRLGPLAVTERACLDPARMDQERRYLEALSQVDSYLLLEDNQRLLLSSQENSQRLEYIRQ